jgi:hypothetical protein
MNMDEYNKSDRDNDGEKARYAESEASERFSDASSLPEETAPGLATPEGAVLPETLNSKILMDRGIALAHTGISDRNERSGEWPSNYAYEPRGKHGCVWPRRGGLEKSSANLGRVGNVDD